MPPDKIERAELRAQRRRSRGKRLMAAALGFGLGLLLAGCAQTVWSKPDATAADFERDKAACRFQTAGSGDPIFAALYLGDCMRGRGWTSSRD